MHTKYLLEWYVTDDVPCLAIKVTYTSRMGREMGVLKSPKHWFGYWDVYTVQLCQVSVVYFASYCGWML